MLMMCDVAARRHAIYFLVALVVKKLRAHNLAKVHKSRKGMEAL